jgi:hypothetical protein
VASASNFCCGDEVRPKWLNDGVSLWPWQRSDAVAVCLGALHRWRQAFGVGELAVLRHQVQQRHPDERREGAIQREPLLKQSGVLPNALLQRRWVIQQHRANAGVVGRCAAVQHQTQATRKLTGPVVPLHQAIDRRLAVDGRIHIDTAIQRRPTTGY